MIRIRTFGPLAVHVDGAGEHLPLLRQPKRLALLIYLAVRGREGPIGRDELLGLFWPESPEGRARQALNQAIHFLRKHLGSDAITGIGEGWLDVDAAAVGCDARDFEEAYLGGEWRRALDLYTGPFLEHFIVPSAPELETWISQWRESARQRAAECATNLANELEASGDLAAAAELHGRAALIAPEDEGKAVVALDAFARAGVPSNAVRWFDGYARAFELALDTRPSDHLVRRAESLRALARTAESDAVDEPLAPGGVQHAATAGRQKHTALLAGAGRVWRFAAVLLIVASAAVGGRLLLDPAHTADLSSEKLGWVIVGPFTDQSTDPPWPAFAEMLTESVATRLHDPTKLPVFLARGGGPPVSNTPLARLGYGFVVTGIVLQSGAEVRVDVAIREAGSENQLAAFTVLRPRGEVLQVLDDMIDELDRRLRRAFGRTIRDRPSGGSKPKLEAWTELQKSRTASSDARRFGAVGSLEQARWLFAIADSLALNASRLDSGWRDPLLQRARVRRHLALFELQSGAMGRAIAHAHLDTAAYAVADVLSRWKADAIAHQLAGTIAYERWLTGVDAGDPSRLLEEADSHLRRAVAVDPHAAGAWTLLSSVSAARRDHAVSAVAATRALEADVFLEAVDEAQNRLFHAHFNLGNDDQAEYWCDQIASRHGPRGIAAYCRLVLLAWVDHLEPDTALARTLIEGLTDPPPMRAVLEPRLILLQAAIAARAGDPRKTAGLIDGGLEKAAPDDPRIQIYHAAALHHAGQSAAARAALRQTGDRMLGRFPHTRWLDQIGGGSL